MTFANSSTAYLGCMFSSEVAEPSSLLASTPPMGTTSFRCEGLKVFPRLSPDCTIGIALGLMGSAKGVLPVGFSGAPEVLLPDLPHANRLRDE